MEYEPGDHLCVVPVNDAAVVDRLLNRFGLDRDSYVRIESRSDMRGPFPSGSTFSVLNLAKTAGELQAVATRKDMAMLARFVECPNSKSQLEALAAPAAEDGTDLYADEVLAKRKSVLDVLEDFPACALPLAVFLELIPFLSPRASSKGRPCLVRASLKGPAQTILQTLRRAINSKLWCESRLQISACPMTRQRRSSWWGPVQA